MRLKAWFDHSVHIKIRQSHGHHQLWKISIHGDRNGVDDESRGAVRHQEMRAVGMMTTEPCCFGASLKPKIQFDAGIPQCCGESRGVVQSGTPNHVP